MQKYTTRNKSCVLICLLIISSCEIPNRNSTIYYFPIYENNKWTTIDNHKKVLEISNGYEIISPFRENMAIIRKDSLFGFIDKNGEILVPPQYSYVFPFSCERALVGSIGESFFINKNGERIIDVSDYDSRVLFSDDVLCISRNDSSIFLDKAGDFVFSCPYPYYAYGNNNGIIKVWNSDTVAYYNNQGKFINKFKGLGRYGDYSEGTILVDHNYFINLNGEKIINYTGFITSDFYNGRAIVRIFSSDNKSYSFIDTTGELVKPYLFDKIEAFKYNFAPALIDRKWGVIDINGDWVCPPKFSNLKMFDDEHIIFTLDKKWGYATVSGEIIWTGNVENFSEEERFLWREYIW